jgi:hypothetical protein
MCAPESKSQMFAGRGHRLMSVCDGIPFTLAEPRKAKAVEYIGVWTESIINMNGTGRKGDKYARRNNHAIWKCERAQCKGQDGFRSSERWGTRISISDFGCRRGNLTNKGLDHQAVGSPGGNCRSCASCLFQLSSNLPL